MSLEEQSARGVKAEALLKDPLFNEAFELVRKAVLDGIENLPIEQAVEAEQLRLSLKLLRAVRAQVEQAARDGKVAAFRLNEERRKAMSPSEWMGIS